MVTASVGAVVLPCMPFYLSPLKSSRFAHRLATGRELFSDCITKDTPPPFNLPSTTFGYTPVATAATRRGVRGAVRTADHTTTVALARRSGQRQDLQLVR